MRADNIFFSNKFICYETYILFFHLISICDNCIRSTSTNCFAKYWLGTTDRQDIGLISLWNISEREPRSVAFLWPYGK